MTVLFCSKSKKNIPVKKHGKCMGSLFPRKEMWYDKLIKNFKEQK